MSRFGKFSEYLMTSVCQSISIRHYLAGVCWRRNEKYAELTFNFSIITGNLDNFYTMGWEWCRLDHLCGKCDRTLKKGSSKSIYKLLTALRAVPPGMILVAGEVWWVQNVGYKVGYEALRAQWGLEMPATSEWNGKIGKSSKLWLNLKELYCAFQTHILFLL